MIEYLKKRTDYDRDRSCQDREHVQWLERLECDDLMFNVKTQQTSTSIERSHIRLSYASAWGKAYDKDWESLGCLILVKINGRAAAARGIKGLPTDKPSPMWTVKRLYEELPSIEGQDVLVLKSIAIKPAYQNKGLVKHLFAKILDFHDPFYLDQVLIRPDSHRSGTSPKDRKSADAFLQEILGSMEFKPVLECSHYYALTPEALAERVVAKAFRIQKGDFVRLRWTSDPKVMSEPVGDGSPLVSAWGSFQSAEGTVVDVRHDSSKNTTLLRLDGGPHEYDVTHVVEHQPALKNAESAHAFRLRHSKAGLTIE